MRHFLDGGSNRTFPLVGVSFDGDDHALVITSESDYPIRRPLNAREEPLRLFIKRVVDDHVDLEVHGSTVSNIRSIRNPLRRRSRTVQV